MGTITRNELKDWFLYDGNMMVLNRLTKSLPHFNNDYYLLFLDILPKKLILKTTSYTH